MMNITLSIDDTSFQLILFFFNSTRLRSFSENHIYFLEEGKCLFNNIQALCWKNLLIKRLGFDWKNMSENGKNMYMESELRELQQQTVELKQRRS